MTTTKPTPTYSSAPAICVHIDSLSATRFILPSTRQYPYRDALGRINLNLVNASLAEAEVDGAPAAARDKLAAWQRHASRALKNIPEDEKQTLDEIAASSEDGEDAQSSSGRETTSEEEKEPPKTTHATRRLFRLPNTNDEPHFDFDDEAAPEADRLYLGQLTEGQNFKRSRNASPRKKSTPNKRKRHATRNSLPLPLLPARRVALPLLRSPFPGANDDEEERSSSEITRRRRRRMTTRTAPPATASVTSMRWRSSTRTSGSRASSLDGRAMARARSVGARVEHRAASRRVVPSGAQDGPAPPVR